MRIEEIRNIGTENLLQELEGSERELFNLRFQKATQQLSDTTGLRKTRRNIARMKTVLRERELAAEAQADAQKEAATP
ncbi:MAG: 50S ribosomal protein L29 [Chloroflexi bacterium]|nr:50S ribosomal protein L29 [Chloroflexota bacterium]